MKRTLSHVIPVLLLLALAISAAGQKKHKTSKSPSVGRWRLNVDKSDYGQAPKPKAGTLTITSDSADSLKWHATLTNADGKKETYSFSGPEDGQPHPVTGNNPWKTAAYTRGDNNAASASVTMKDGSTLTQEFTVSADTLTVKNTTPQGGGTEVWDRVKESATTPY